MMSTVSHLDQRAVGDCPQGQAFYRCAKGPYTGCCSTDPCDTGVCDETDTLSQTSSDCPTDPSGTMMNMPASTVAYHGLPPTTFYTRTTVTVTETIHSASTADDHTSKTVEASSTDTAISTSMHHSTVPHTKVSPTTSKSSVSNPSSSLPTILTGGKPHIGPSAGAAAGGIIAALAVFSILALLAYCCLKRKAQAKFSVGLKRTTKQTETESDAVAKQKQKDEMDEQAAILAERERTLRRLEARDTISGKPAASDSARFKLGKGTDGPKNSTYLAHKVWI